MDQMTRMAPAPKIDVLAYDADGFPVLLVEVKEGRAHPSARAQVLGYQLMCRPPVPFGMVVDPFEIIVLDSSRPDEVVATLSTPEILGRYEPRFAETRIYHFYFGVLVEGWLDDLATHWKHADPPAGTVLEGVGLLPRLVGGTVRTEAKLHGHLVRWD